MRKAVLTAVLVTLASVARMEAHPLADLDAGSRAESQASDLRAVVVFREGLARTVALAASRPDLFPAARRSGSHLLNEADRATVRETWKSFLDYTIALDSLERFHVEYAALSWRDRAASFQVARGAFLAQYRFAFDFIRRVENDPKLPILLNDPMPGLGLPAGSYDRLKFRFLNATASSQLAAYGALAILLPATPEPELARAVAEDESLLWKAAAGRRQALTVTNAVNVLRKLGHRLTFPVQAGVSEWMGDTKVLRRNRALISTVQIAALPQRLDPGDVLLQRREWYMSNVGLPGFWSHAALYVGTPEERRAYFDAPEVHRWVVAQGEKSGDFEKLLEWRYPKAYALSLKTQEGGHVPRVLEAISEGVVFTTLEHSAAADSMAALRPRLERAEKAQALLRAFQYMGRPYDFDFDFQTDSALVCTELVYKAYEPTPGFRGIRLELEEIVGRTAIPANSIARQLDDELRHGVPQFDMVLFLDGREKQGVAVEASVEDLRQSWRRPKWHVIAQAAGR
jgi:Permuted papain-like amidase enzyme, YaeF/YiiX, C92 family